MLKMEVHHYKIGVDSIYIKTHAGESFHIPRNAGHIDELAKVLGEHTPRVIALLEEIIMRLKHRQEKNKEHHEKLFQNRLSKAKNRDYKERWFDDNKERVGEALLEALQRMFGAPYKEKSKGREYHRPTEKIDPREDFEMHEKYILKMGEKCLQHQPKKGETSDSIAKIRRSLAQYKNIMPGAVKDKKFQARWGRNAKTRAIEKDSGKVNHKKKKKIAKQHNELYNTRTGVSATFLRSHHNNHRFNLKEHKAQELLQFAKMIGAQQAGKLRLLGDSTNAPHQEQGLQIQREQMISPQWVMNNVGNLSTLFLAFQRLVFDKDDPRDFHQLTKDEQNILKREFTSSLEHIIENRKENDPTMALSTNVNQEIQTLGLKDELAKLFGEGETLGRRWNQHRAYKDYDPDSGEKESSGLTPEEEKMKQAGFAIYKKLLALSLYHQGKLNILTANGKEVFKNPSQAKDSIDGMVYYKSHQKKYAGEKFYKFFYSEDYGKDGVFVALTDLKIEDFSFESLEKAFQPLGDLEIAPLFYMIIAESLFPMAKPQNPSDTPESLEE